MIQNVVIKLYLDGEKYFQLESYTFLLDSPWKVSGRIFLELKVCESVINTVSLKIFGIVV